MSDKPEGHKDESVTLPSLGAVGWARWAWRRLTSMRTALLLLMLLAVAAIPGSVFPQTRINPSAVDAYLADHPTSGPWLQRIGAFDVYASPWFSAVYLLLFVSLVGCVVPRSRLHWKAARAAPPAAPRRLERMPAYARAEVDTPPEQVLEAARAALKQRRYRRADGANSVAGEKGHAAETGNLVFHLALLALLVAIAAGSFLGWSGQAIVTVGKTWANTVPGYDSFTPGRAVDAADLAPFSFSLDKLTVRFEEEVLGNQFGAPRDFQADITLTEEPGERPEKRVVRVNQPLDVDGTRVFLVGNGYAPVVTVRDGNGDVAFSGPVTFLPADANYTSNGVVAVPDARPQQIGLTGFLLPTAAQGEDRRPFSIFPDARNPVLFLTAWVGDLGMDDGVPQSVYVLDTDRMTQLKQPDGSPFSVSMGIGQTVQLPDGAGSVTFDELRRYAALDVRYDPTKGWALAAALLALAGLIASLFVRRRRVWVRVSQVPGDDLDGGVRTLVEVAGLSRTEDGGLTGEIDELLRRLTGGAGESAARPEPAEPAVSQEPAVRE